MKMSKLLRFRAKCDTRDMVTQFDGDEDDCNADRSKRETDLQQKKSFFWFFGDRQKNRGFEFNEPMIKIDAAKRITDHLGFPLAFVGMYFGIANFKKCIAHGNQVGGIVMLAGGGILTASESRSSSLIYL